MRFSGPTTSDLGGILAWARSFIDDLNRFHPTIDELPTFADDAAADAGRVKIGQGYVTPDGAVRRRII